MERLDVLMGDIGHLHLAQGRQDEIAPHATLIGLGTFSLPRQVIRLILPPEVLDGWGCPVGVAVPHGIATQIDLPLHVLGRLARRGNRPLWIAADGDPALATAGTVIQNE